MNTKKQWIFIASAVCCITTLSAGIPATINSEKTQDDEFEICALQGLEGVGVEVVRFFSAFEEEKLSREPINLNNLQAQAELALKKAGIKVFEKSSQNPDIAVLIITVNTWETRRSSDFIVQVKTELYQPAVLLRDGRLRLMAPTWPAGSAVQESQMTELIRLHSIKQRVEQEIQRQTQIFIDAYRRANPQVQSLITGTIRYMNFEGGFYGIIADNGQRYDPVNLPHEFAKDGLRVKFRVKEKKEMSSIHMWGKIVEIVKIERL